MKYTTEHAEQVGSNCQQIQWLKYRGGAGVLLVISDWAFEFLVISDLIDQFLVISDWGAVVISDSDF